MTTERRSTLRQRLLAILIAGIGAMAASAVSFAMAVYDAAHPEPVPVIAAGQSIDTGRWFVSVHEARVGSMPPTGVTPPRPTMFVMVEFDIENRAAESAYASTNLFALAAPAPELEAPEMYLARDLALAGPLNPAMPERLIATWEWPQDAPPPDEIRLLVNSQIYKRRDNLYGASGWFDGEPAGIVELAFPRDSDEEAGR